MLQFRVLPPDDQNADTGIGQRTAKGFHPQHMGLAAATGAAVGHIPCAGLAEQLLLWIQVAQIHAHRSAAVFEVLISHGAFTFPGIVVLRKGPPRDCRRPYGRGFVYQVGILMATMPFFLASRTKAS